MEIQLASGRFKRPISSAARAAVASALGAGGGLAGDFAGFLGGGGEVVLDFLPQAHDIPDPGYDAAGFSTEIDS